MERKMYVLEGIEYIENKDSRHLSLRLLSKVFKYFITSVDFSVGMGGDVGEDLPFSGKYSVLIYLNNVIYRDGKIIYKQNSDDTYIVFTPIEGELYKVTDMGGNTEILGYIRDDIKLWAEFSFDEVVDIIKSLNKEIKGLKSV